MKVWTDNQGNPVSGKEFIQRWKAGIEGVTPLQQSKVQFWNGWLIVLGIALGIIVSAINWKELWWLIIILVGALVNTLMMQVSNYQRYINLKRIDDLVKGGKENE